MNELASLIEAIIDVYAGTFEWLKRKFGWPAAVLGTILLPTVAIVAIVVGLFWAF